MKEVTLTKPYSFGAYNKVGEEEQWIRLTEEEFGVGRERLLY